MRASLLALSTASVFSFVFAACGGSSNGSGSNGATSTSTSTSASGAGASSTTSTGSSMGGSSGGSGGSGGGSTTIACTGEPSTLSLSGTWVAYGELGVKLQGVPGGAITICPADQTGESTLLLMMQIQQDASDPTKLSQVSATLCSLELPVVTALVGECDPTSDALVSAQIIAPQALIDALPDVATMPVTGTLSGASDGADFSLDRLDVVVGSTMPDPNMPAWNTDDMTCDDVSLGRTNQCDMSCVSDCSSARDDDNDTYPGVTVEVCGYTNTDTQKGVMCNADMPDNPGATLQGRAFIDIEVNPQLTGTAKSSCELTGSVDSKVLYNLMGADVYLAGGQIGVTQAIKSLPSFNVDSSQSKFRMVRVDGKYGAPDFKLDTSNAKASCQTIITNINQIK